MTVHQEAHVSTMGSDRSCEVNYLIRKWFSMDRIFSHIVKYFGFLYLSYDSNTTEELYLYDWRAVITSSEKSISVHCRQAQSCDFFPYQVAPQAAHSSRAIQHPLHLSIHFYDLPVPWGRDIIINEARKTKPTVWGGQLSVQIPECNHTRAPWIGPQTLLSSSSSFCNNQYNHCSVFLLTLPHNLSRERSGPVVVLSTVPSMKSFGESS